MFDSGVRLCRGQAGGTGEQGVIRTSPSCIALCYRARIECRLCRFCAAALFHVNRLRLEESGPGVVEMWDAGRRWKVTMR